jgi:hypothetical protein
LRLFGVYEKKKILHKMRMRYSKLFVDGIFLQLLLLIESKKLPSPYSIMPHIKFLYKELYSNLNFIIYLSTEIHLTIKKGLSIDHRRDIQYK